MRSTSVRSRCSNNFSKNLRWNLKKANRSIGSDIIDRFARFWYHYDLCEFPQERVVVETEHTIVEDGEKSDGLLG
jgi:hypothetical protein